MTLSENDAWAALEAQATAHHAQGAETVRAARAAGIDESACVGMMTLTREGHFTLVLEGGGAFSL